MSAAPDRLSGGAAAGRQEAVERPWWRRTLDALWQVVVATVGSCMRHRVTGLAAEAAFFAVLSVPPLIFAMAGAIGYVSDQFTAAQIDDVRQAVLDLASRALTDRAVDKIITPTIDDVLGGGRLDVISVGFVLALWSGSRAMHVFVDTITIMHGLGGHRGIIKTRALSFGLYLLAMLTGVVSIPLIVAGPSLVRAWLPDQLDFLMAFYWPAVLALSICFLATLYHVSVPVRTNWTFNLPGATFSLACWILGSFALRWFLTATAADSRSIYGPLAAPIAVLLWLYLVAIAVLIGAAVNASFDSVFPQKATTSARLELVQRLRQRMAREADEDHRRVGGASGGRGARFGPCRTSVTSRALLVDPHLGVSRIALPERARSPWWELGRRMLLAAAPSWSARSCSCTSTARATATATTRRQYAVDFNDSIYYTTVTLSTTGYGDIAPVTDRARMVNAFIITPFRIAFLVLLIGTTLEVLASQGREMFRSPRWRKNMGEHVVIVGYGTKGRSAVETLVNNGQDREAIVVVDKGATALADAHADGLAVVTGDATRREVLQRAGISTASHVIITTDRDDSNVLATLTVRQLNPEAWIVSAVREQENVPLMKQSGADSVITSSDAVGRLLGLSSLSPTLGSVMEDLLTYGEGLEVAERDLLVTEVGKQPQSLPDQVISVVRDEKVYRYFDPVVTQLARGDRLIVVRPAKELPWAPRPGTHNEALADEED